MLSAFRKPYIAALHDMLMAAGSFLLSLYLRLGSQFDIHDPFLQPALMIFTGVCTGVFLMMGLYKGMWRYASIPDLIALTKAVTLAILLFLPVMFLFNRLEGMPRSVVFINWFVLLAMLGGPRFLYRMLKDRTLRIDMKSNPARRIPVLVIGINDFTEAFLRHTGQRKTSEYEVVALVDVHGEQVGRQMHHIPIFGNIDTLGKMLEKLRRKGKSPQKIVIAPDSIEGNALKQILALAEEHGLTVARLPRVTELYDPQQDSVPLRPIAIEDLLGRAQNTLDRSGPKTLIKGKTVLVTGGGGTIGGELCRQIAGYSPAQLVVYEHSEHNLYCIDKELRQSFSSLDLIPVIGDVRDKKRLEETVERTAPDIIFHAAALKHVPLAEINPLETATTNIIGTRNVADACIQHNVKLMVMISTDKAVSPSSVMGASKRAAECYIQALDQSRKAGKTKFATVRFGNVLGSSGSVVPLFHQQLEQGGPLTVTHPDMKRYFMTVREAVELVLQAAHLRYDSESVESSIYVLDMGEPVYIRDMAEQMIRLAGLTPYKDIQIIYSGIRPGEKLEETLFDPREDQRNTPLTGVQLAVARNQKLSSIQSYIKKLEKSPKEEKIMPLLLDMINN
ncbi:MAG: polysaccharide biosynthesis protein [Hyphomicrobiales bacterium]|nr:polysaccharide biosynthesis protein [Hyphomicrobiales bacterium]